MRGAERWRSRRLIARPVRSAHGRHCALSRKGKRAGPRAQARLFHGTVLGPPVADTDLCIARYILAHVSVSCALRVAALAFEHLQASCLLGADTLSYAALVGVRVGALGF